MLELIGNEGRFAIELIDQLLQVIELAIMHM
jgi:hypothetical protein